MLTNLPWLRSGIVGLVGFGLGAAATIAGPKAPGDPAEQELNRTVVAPAKPADERPGVGREEAPPQPETSPAAAAKSGLDLDNSRLRKKLEARDQKTIAFLMAQIRTEYDTLFAKLDVDPSAKEELLKQVELVYRAKIELRKYMTQLASAQYGCDRLAKDLLGEKYDNYRSHEDTRKAREESDQIAAYFKKTGGPDIPPDRWLALQEVIQKNGAYSDRTLSSIFGPFDGLATPQMGARNVVPAIEAEQAAFARKVAAVVEAVQKLNFSPAEIATLQNYYSSQITAYENHLAGAKDPLGASLPRLEAKLSVMKSDVNTTPEKLAEMEQLVQSLRASIAARKTP